MEKNNLKGGIMLLFATVFWGSTFVAQEEAAKHLGSFTVNCLRAVIAIFMLVPLALILKKSREKKSGIKEKLLSKRLIIGGVLCGVAMSVASNLQQFGIMFNAELSEGGSGKAGFITAMYIIFVPFISVIFGQKLKFSTVLAMIIGVAGLYFISVKEGFTVSAGDIVLLMCALAFAIHIIVVDKFAAKVDAVALSAVQFITAAVISGTLMLIFELDTVSLANILGAALPLLYCGVMSSGVAFTLQIISQRYTEATVASLIMSLESLFATVTACIFYGKLPTEREAVGSLLMMIAIFIVVTPFADKAVAKLFKKQVNV